MTCAVDQTLKPTTCPPAIVAISRGFSAGLRLSLSTASLPRHNDRYYVSLIIVTDDAITLALFLSELSRAPQHFRADLLRCTALRCLLLEFIMGTAVLHFCCNYYIYHYIFSDWNCQPTNPSPPTPSLLPFPPFPVHLSSIPPSTSPPSSLPTSPSSFRLHPHPPPQSRPVPHVCGDSLRDLPMFLHSSAEHYCEECRAGAVGNPNPHCLSFVTGVCTVSEWSQPAPGAQRCTHGQSIS